MAGIVALTGGAFVFAWSGLYDIAASDGHWKIVERFLEFGMRNSVKMNAAGIEAPQLDNPDLIRLGAGHFHRGCAFCHGAPGMPVNPIAKQMLPSPPVSAYFATLPPEPREAHLPAPASSPAVDNEENSNWLVDGALDVFWTFSI
jgi:hypothetical protein